MNLTILIGHFPPGAFGGAELQAESWARQLGDRHQVTVVTRRDPPDQPPGETRDGFRVVRLPVSRLPLVRSALDLRGIGRAVAALDPRPDLLLCFQTFISGLAGVRVQRRLAIPAVVWVRGEAEYRLGHGRRMRAVSPRVWTEARGVLVQSDGVRNELLGELERAAPGARAVVAGKLEVVPNGLDLPDQVEPPGGRVLTVGRLIADKGMDIVIDAVAGMQGLLTLAGEGPERERLEVRARAHGLDARFEGFVSRARLELLYRDAWVVVLAAHRGEGQSNVVMEAFARGRPVVATEIPGVRELVVDGVNGLLVPAGDVRALRDALTRLAHERGLAERLARAGRETAATYAWPRVRPRLEALLARWSAR